MADSEGKTSAYDSLTTEQRKIVDNAVETLGNLSARNNAPYDRKGVRDYIMKASEKDPHFFESIEVTQPSTSSIPRKIGTDTNSINV
ncbi:MAG: hypothetical protein AABY33_02955 [Pseudomonadota bacterium]